jgi:hypothetical protein
MNTKIDLIAEYTNAKSLQKEALKNYQQTHDRKVWEAYLKITDLVNIINQKLNSQKG